MQVLVRKILLVISLVVAMCASAVGVCESVVIKAEGLQFTSPVPFQMVRYGKKYRNNQPDPKPITIEYMKSVITPSESNRVLVVSPGRGESYLKYRPLLSSLFDMGYKAIYIIDHRGQGLSTRLLDHPYKGYVENYDAYVADLKYLVEEKVRADYPDSKIDLLAHSMGGGIAGLYLTSGEGSKVINKAVFVNPLWGFGDLNGYSPGTAKTYLSFTKCSGRFSKSCLDYASADSQDPEPSSLEENKNTQSKKWHEYTEKIAEEFPQTLLGGATNGWVLASIKASFRFQEESLYLDTPTLLLFSEEDQHMNPETLKTTCVNMGSELPERKSSKPVCKPQFFKGALHEILFEREAIREKGIQFIKNFFFN